MRLIHLVYLGLVTLVTAGCQSSAIPELPPVAVDGATGVVFIDDGDGQLGDGDHAIAGALVTALVVASDNGYVNFAPNPNVAVTRTDDAGGFTLVSSQQPIEAVQISLEAQVEGSDVVGLVDYRVVLSSSNGNLIPIAPPTACSQPDSAECGQDLLPDLTPIIDASELEESVQQRLRLLADLPNPDDDRRTGFFPAETWFIEEGEPRLLRFATVAANIGAGPVDIIAGEGVSGAAPTWQRIWMASNQYRDRQAGSFIDHPTHRHIHFDAFERYALLTVDGELVAEAGKVSFCLRDSIRIDPGAAPTTGVFPSEDCGSSQQAINPGYGDHYGELLDDQWIDITGVEPGTYVVEVTVDPLDLLVESDETNNQGTFTINIPPLPEN